MAQWWLHCNGCGILMLEAKQQRPGNKYWLSACGHIFCDQCNRRCERDRKCRCCRHSSFRSAAVDSTLPEKVRRFFKPVGRLYEDAMQHSTTRLLASNVHIWRSHAPFSGRSKPS
uniref:RING-type domain-containing protein n=1 Tax=Parascaris univalens TaxID=6257 RepID=A0A915A5C2_PARUN